MKNLGTVLALVIGLVAPLEAGIEYRARTWQEGQQKNRQAESSVKALVDGDQAKILFEDSGNPSMPAGSYLMTTDGGQTIHLVKPADKTYGEFDLDAAMQMLNAMSETGMVDIQIENARLEKLATGPNKSVAGVDAKHARYGMSYEMRMKIIGLKKTQTVETVQDIWYTDALSDAGLSLWVRRDLPKTGTDLDELIALEASKIKGFPVETVETMTVTSKKGKQRTTTTHTLVSDLRQGVSFPAGTFVIPEDYTPVQMMPTAEMLGDQAPQDGERKGAGRGAGWHARALQEVRKEEGVSEPRLVDRRIAFDGRMLKVEIERLRLPDGGTTELEIIRHPGGAAVVPVTDSGEILLVRQYRYATGQWLLEAPAGKLAPGEPPESCARRELEEETGWRATAMESLGSIWCSPGFTDEVLHLFLARGLVPGTQALEESELLTIETLAGEEAIAMARDGRISDSKTVCALLRASQALSG